MIRYVMEKDIPNALALMEVVRDDFAGYKETEFVKALKEAIGRQEALMEEYENTIAGMLLFSRKEKELSFLAVHPAFRKQGIARRLIGRMAESFKVGDQLYVITFRKGDPKGIAARACYHGCGFQDAEELTVFEYPCQKLVLKL